MDGVRPVGFQTFPGTETNFIFVVDLLPSYMGQNRTGLSAPFAPRELVLGNGIGTADRDC